MIYGHDIKKKMRLIKNKKGIASHNYWLEMIGSIILVVGFLFSTFSGSGVMSIIILFLGGMIFGRIRFRTRTHSKMPLFFLTLFFLFGYIIGTILILRLFKHIFTWTFFFILIFILGNIASYMLHEKKIIRDNLF